MNPITRGATAIARLRGVHAGPNAVIAATAKLHQPRRIWIGAQSQIDHGVEIAPNGGTVRIGDNSSLNKGSYVDGAEDVTIGSDCRIAAGTHLGARTHDNSTTRGLVLEDDVWVGALAMIHAGVTVGSGSVIGAGAVVTATVPPFSIVLGNPARIVGQRGH